MKYVPLYFKQILWGTPTSFKRGHIDLLDCFKVRDLLGKDQSVRLEVKERPDVGVYVKELSVFMVNNADDMDKLMTVGNRWEGVTTTNSVSLFRRKRERL